MSKNIPVQGEVWQHYKTKGEYTVLGIGQMQVKIADLDMKECVIYKSLSDEKIWVRPLVDFCEDINLTDGKDSVSRFVKIR